MIRRLFARLRRRARPRLPTPPIGYDMDASLAQRRQGRGERNARSRRGQATIVHRTFARDVMIHREVRF